MRSNSGLPQSSLWGTVAGPVSGAASTIVEFCVCACFAVGDILICSGETATSALHACMLCKDTIGQCRGCIRCCCRHHADHRSKEKEAFDK
jgi:hypothetical protein